MKLENPLQIDVVGLDALIKSKQNIAILDVREPWEVDLCALAGSKNIPLNELPAKVQELSKDVPLVVLCHHGMRSLRAVQWLRGQGFGNAINLAGGIDAWARQVDPGMRIY